MTSVAFAADEYCWKDTYGRGVGTIPAACNDGDYQNGLCYSKCPAGMYGEGPVCWSGCPAGYVDRGPTCHINMELSFPSSWENVCHRGLFGECWWIREARCPSGYTTVLGVCYLTARSTPAGFSGTYLDPMKNTHARGVGTIPSNCGSGKQYDAGLCYNNCRSGYSGVGPVCWGQPPSGWVNCAMGAAKDNTTCATVTSGQVMSFATLAMNAATMGTQAGATAAATSPAKIAWVAKVKAEYTRLKALYDANQVLIRAAMNSPGAGLALGAAIANPDPSPEEMVRLAATIASLMDPTGVANVVESFTYPKCDRISTTNPGAPVTPGAPVAPVAPGTPGQSSSGTWVSASGGQVPANAVRTGEERGIQLYVCRATLPDGSKHPGKLIAGDSCHIGYGGQEPRYTNYEVLVGGVTWAAATSGNIPANAILGGVERGLNMFVCRSSMPNGTVQGGKLFAGSGCHVGWNGIENKQQVFEVALPSGTAQAPAIPQPAPFMGCQQMSNTLGTSDGVTWGNANADQQKQWIANGCRTKPQGAIPSPNAGGQANFIQWNPNANQGAVLGGNNGAQYGGAPLYVCRANHAGGVHPGKLLAGLCNIGYGGREVVLRAPFEVLVGNGNWGPPQGQLQGALIGGSEPGRSLPICRATFNGGVHPGKVVAGKCNIGWGGREHEVPSFEVFYTR